MLRRITRIKVKIDDNLPAGTAHNEITPLRSWSARDSDDYGIALAGIGAYVADILTFYQERIANEAFIRTANLPASLMRLAGRWITDLRRGVAASAYLVFTMKDGTSAQLRWYITGERWVEFDSGVLQLILGEVIRESLCLSATDDRPYSASALSSVRDWLLFVQEVHPKLIRRVARAVPSRAAAAATRGPLSS